MEASEDKAIKEKIRKVETVSRNECQKKELTDFNTGRIFPFSAFFFYHALASDLIEFLFVGITFCRTE